MAQNDSNGMDVRNLDIIPLTLRRLISGTLRQLLIELVVQNIEM